MIDLRSDTITRPTDAMRRAMADAIVGDDVYHDDPTVNELEAEVASILGKDEAMYVPSGTMANQIDVRMHTQPGDVVVIESGAHIGGHEMGGAAHHSGVTLARIGGRMGMFTADQLRGVVPTPHPSLPRHLYEPYTLVCLENTHNEAGGTVWDLDVMREVGDAAEDLGLARHLDGARLWNASAATGVDVADYADTVDTVGVCFSKGLGAPIGSALAGPAEFIAEARRFKQMFGGGMRQSGIIAAGALHALRNHRDRLVEDHANARHFAERIAEADGADVDPDAVHTNIVYFEVDDPAAVVATSLDDGVAMLAFGRRRIRAVFHRDVSEADTAMATEIVAAAIEA
jgi:threonine aldolase